MKTKAYKLAQDLAVPEEALLDWLRANGYPNARRGDTIRAEVVEAARRALSPRRTGEIPRVGRPAPPPTQPIETQTVSPRTTGSISPVAAPPARPSGTVRPVQRPSEGFRVSFAELLEEHLPQSLTDAVAATPAATTSAPQPRATGAIPPVRPTPRPSGGVSQEEVLKLRLTRAETDRDQARRELEILQQRLEADQVRLGAARAALAEIEIERQSTALLRLEHERVLMERLTLRQALQAALDEQGTLEQTCADLQAEVHELKEGLAAADAERDMRSAMVGELESSIQREVAWRARALELERMVQMGNSLPALLQGFGLEDAKLQADVMRALLADRDTAVALLKTIRQIDAAALSKLIAGRVTRVCAHPICEEVARIDERVRVRVDDATRCEICQGQTDRRWFARLVRECSRAGARRLLVIGGDERTHTLLRDLSQGQPVDLRLVPDNEGAPQARVRGRVESCDVVVLWSVHLVPAEVSEPYAQAAQAEGRPVVHVLGDRYSVADMARAVSIRLARNHILVAT